MKYPTKQKRLCAIADSYSKKFGKPSYTAEEVAAWAIREGLYPVPKRGDPAEIGEAWEEVLEEKSSPSFPPVGIGSAPDAGSLGTGEA